MNDRKHTQREAKMEAIWEVITKPLIILAAQRELEAAYPNVAPECIALAVKQANEERHTR